MKFKMLLIIILIFEIICLFISISIAQDRYQSRVASGELLESGYEFGKCYTRANDRRPSDECVLKSRKSRNSCIYYCKSINENDEYCEKQCNNYHEVHCCINCLHGDWVGSIPNDSRLRHVEIPGDTLLRGNLIVLPQCKLYEAYESW